MSSKARNLLSSGVTNVAQSFYDNFVQSNAELRASAGVRAVIIRRVNRPCCDWCKSLEGRYDIDDAPDNIYRRHKDCDCTVVCYDEKGYTDAWSKKVYQTEQEARKANAREIEAKQKTEEREGKERKNVDFYTGPNGKTILAKYSEWIGDNKMSECLARAHEKVTKNYIRTDYRKTSFIGDGSTADIREFELATGLNCGRSGGDHSEKVKNLISQINKAMLKCENEDDKKYLKGMLNRLRKTQR